MNFHETLADASAALKEHFEHESIQKIALWDRLRFAADVLNDRHRTNFHVDDLGAHLDEIIKELNDREDAFEKRATQ